MIARILTRRFAANYLSTLAFIGLAYWIISEASGFHRNILNAHFYVGVHTLMHALLAVYVVALVPYYARHPWLHSKAFVFLQGVWFARLRLRRPVSRARRARTAREPMRLPLRASFSPAATQA